MSRRLLIFAALIVAMAYASLLSRNWPSQLDPTFVVSGASTVPIGPTLTSISPSAVTRGSTVSVVMTGSNLTDYTTLSISSAPYISAGAVTVLSTTMLTANLTISATTPTGTFSVSANNGGIYSNPLLFTVSEGLGCSIQMNKRVFANGDPVVAQSVRVTNRGTVVQPVNYRFWIDIPNAPPYAFTQGGADGSVVLTPGLDLDLGPIPLFPVSDQFPRGTYAFGCRFVDTVRGNVLAENVQPFFLQ